MKILTKKLIKGNYLKEKIFIKNKISFKNISYSYPERGRVLDDLSLSIKKGSVIGS